jgi:2-amino-4-hydroxy-6-hydroxymethyldihydropteridine diphosphokinase
VRAFVGLGSNLEGPRDQIRRAVDALAQLENTVLVAVSPLFVSAPVGPEGQPDYVNAVAELDTHLAPTDLLACLQSIEASQGRERGAVRWTARSLDLDLLLYGNDIIDLPMLQVPHPRMMVRNFVLEPLSDLAPDLVFPDGTPLTAARAACPPNPLQRLA